MKLGLFFFIQSFIHKRKTFLYNDLYYYYYIYKKIIVYITSFSITSSLLLED